jgi:hypothetical protein
MDVAGSLARYSMAGWAFLVVLLASVAFSPNQHAWIALTTWLSAAGANQAASGVAAAAFGVVAGLSAPPALGYVLARSGAAIMEYWHTYSRYRNKPQEQAHRHAVFYSRAAQNLIAWQEERTTQVYASVSCALAGIAAVGVAVVVYGAPAPGVILVTAILALLLIGDATYQDVQRGDVVDAWLELPESKEQPPT